MIDTKAMLIRGDTKDILYEGVRYFFVSGAVMEVPNGLADRLESAPNFVVKSNREFDKLMSKARDKGVPVIELVKGGE